MASFPTSARFESWITRLRQPWMRLVGRRIWGGFAAALGDRTVDWATQANLEHLPSYASDTAIGLIANERQLDTYPGEATANLGARAPHWLQIGKFAGSPLGVLLGLHFSGFDGAVLVQQNGLAYQLTLPLPSFVLGQQWDPTPNLVITECAQLAVALTSSVTPTRSIPAGTPWFTFDSNTDCCSRFAILFPDPSAISLITPLTVLGKATFAGTDSALAKWQTPFRSTTYFTIVGPPVITDSIGRVLLCVSGKTGAAVTVRASAAFTGYAYVSALLTPSAFDQQRLQAAVAKWKPAKSLCMGAFVLQRGQFWDWPPGRTWNSPGQTTWDQASPLVLQILGSF